MISDLSLLVSDLPCLRPYINQYSWDVLGKTVSEVKKIPVAELRNAFAESMCAARAVASCTPASWSAAVAWALIFLMMLAWLYCGGTRHLLDCWLAIIRCGKL